MFASCFSQVSFCVFFIMYLFRRKRTKVKECLKLSAILVSALYTANATYLISLDMTTLSASITIGNFSIVMVFILSILVLRAKFSWIKLIAMIASLEAITIMGLSDAKAQEATNAVVGDIIAFISAVLYGVYAILIAYFVPAEREHEINFEDILAFMGMWSIIISIPHLLIVHYTGYETVEMPNLM